MYHVKKVELDLDLYSTNFRRDIINTKFDRDSKIFIGKDQNQLNFDSNDIQQNKKSNLKSQAKKGYIKSEQLIEIKGEDFVGKSNPEDRP